MKRILIGLIIFTMMALFVVPSVLSQTNISQADSSSCHWEEINNGLYGGVVYSLAIGSNNTVYAGTNGGVFKSTDGTNWTAINSGLTVAKVYSLAIDSRDTVYAGTYDGIFKSTNGTNWTEINSGLTNTDVYSLAIDSRDTVYVGTWGGGVFKSTNGTNWTEINNGLTNIVVRSLAIDSHDTVYAGTYGSGVFKYICFLIAAPQNLQANTSNSSVTLSWSSSTQSTYPVAGYAIYKGTSSGEESTTPIATVDANTNSYTDKNVELGTTYYYIVKAFDNQSPANYSEPSNEVMAVCKKLVQEIIIMLWPDNPTMTVNGVSQEIDPGRDTKPIIIPEWGRTVVPIRAIVEALGGTIEWDGTERKVTINFKGTVIELWIDNPKARINGNAVYIDPDNHGVKPIIVNSRTMLPLRFVAESLGCDVGWDNATRTITITYQP